MHPDSPSVCTPSEVSGSDRSGHLPRRPKRLGHGLPWEHDQANRLVGAHVQGPVTHNPSCFNSSTPDTTHRLEPGNSPSVSPAGNSWCSPQWIRASRSLRPRCPYLNTERRMRTNKEWVAYWPPASEMTSARRASSPSAASSKREKSAGWRSADGPARLVAVQQNPRVRGLRLGHVPGEGLALHAIEDMPMHFGEALREAFAHLGRHFGGHDEDGI